MQGFHHREEISVPALAGQLRNYYWMIRVEGRDKSKRRKYYRLVAKEKLRLAELGIDQNLIHQVYRYLSTLKIRDGLLILDLLESTTIQLSFNFNNNRG